MLGADADATPTLLMLKANRVAVCLSGLMLLADGLIDGKTMKWPKPHLATRCTWGAKIGITTASGVCVLSFFLFGLSSVSTTISFASFFSIFLHISSPLFTYAYFLNNFRSIVVPVVVRIAARILFSLIYIVVEVSILLFSTPTLVSDSVLWILAGLLMSAGMSFVYLFLLLRVFISTSFLTF